jgi:hypothetical protein
MSLLNIYLFNIKWIARRSNCLAGNRLAVRNRPDRRERMSRSQKLVQQHCRLTINGVCVPWREMSFAASTSWFPANFWSTKL